MVPVPVTGVGVVSCAGADLKSFWENALAGRSGLDEAGLGSISAAQVEAWRERVPDAQGLSKPALLAYVAIRAAMAEAGWSTLDPDDGLIIATTVGQIPLWENELTQFMSQKIDAQAFGQAIAHQSLGSIVEALSAKLGFRGLGFRGKSLLVTSACSAATQAIGLASLWIRQGKVKRCLVGGTEVLSRLTIEGFRSLQLLSSEPTRPFDRNRKGINLSEGSAFFCLEASSDQATSAISGVGFSTDAYHMAAPHPEGRGSFQAMQAALLMAGISPSEVDWIHAHGTGSRANDQSEGMAIAQLFGAEGPWVSSTKGIHGHSLGASGAIEMALCVQAMRGQIVLKTAGLIDPDPALQLRHPDSNQRTEIQHLVKNTLGFGGNNAALVLTRMSASTVRGVP
jgi:3-oxoacyl-(acyl-carrier-protein) synthase